MSFKNDFIWGAATASYQIEGAAREDGKGLSIWDVFTEQKDRVYQFHNGDVACDHYHKLEEDLDLMKEIGLKAYRFSVSWPRIMPNGIGEVNEKGIDFYNRLIDGLIARDIEPFMTLYHWDYPYELYKKGHWLNRDCVKWFAEYTKVIMENFGDRVRYFFTHNEPQCFLGLSNMDGVHAPGIKLGERDICHMIHHSLLAHGESIKLIREMGRDDVIVGFAPVGAVASPKTLSEEDIQLSKKAMFDPKPGAGMREIMWSASTFNDPAFLGIYPTVAREYMDKYLSYDIDADLKIIKQPLDFIGVNIYQGIVVGMVDGEEKMIEYPVGHATNKMGWPITEDALYWGPRNLYERYKKPVVITENGLSLSDWKSVDGKVHDPNRIDFLTRYIGRLEDAAADGVEVMGYFQWSLMDNFEWAEGYKDRFGLIYVDYQSLERTLKDSAYWYKDVIVKNSIK